MVRSISTALLAGVVWVAFAALPPLLPAATTIGLSGSALAATTVQGTRSNGSFKVTGVDAKARTFTGVAKDGKQLTFIVAKGKPLPTVGKIYDVTYIENPKGGPAQATTTNWSRSNQSD